MKVIRLRACAILLEQIGWLPLSCAFFHIMILTISLARYPERLAMTVFFLGNNTKAIITS